MIRTIRYNIKNLEPVRIANDETSQHGQTDTLHYLPGSTIRGVVVNKLASQPAFAQWKRALLSNSIHFMNAYPSVNKQVLIPSLKGFYEDKKEADVRKEIENVIEKDVEPGHKRAALGHYCSIDESCIYYTDVAVYEDLNLNLGRSGKRNVFRSQYLSRGQHFVGFITLDDSVSEELAEAIRIALSGKIYVGNRRGSGYGLCECDAFDIEEMPYSEYRTADSAEKIYMVLLSNTAMRDEYGEICGLCLSELEEKLAVKDLEIVRCATSVAEVYGYVRIWKGSIPSAVMYEAGSVFCLKASEPFQENRMRKLEKEGIGIRRNEGFGQIAFMKEFPCLKYKQKIDRKSQTDMITDSEYKDSEESVQNDLKMAARGLLQHYIERGIDYYVATNKLKLEGISNSKLGNLEAICSQFRSIPSKGIQEIEGFLQNSVKKNNRMKGHSGQTKQDKLHEYIVDVLKCDLLEKLGIQKERLFGISVKELVSENEFSEQLAAYRMQLIMNQIRYENRREKK